MKLGFQDLVEFRPLGEIGRSGSSGAFGSGDGWISSTCPDLARDGLRRAGAAEVWRWTSPARQLERAENTAIAAA